MFPSSCFICKNEFVIIMLPNFVHKFEHSFIHIDKVYLIPTKDNFLPNIQHNNLLYAFRTFIEKYQWNKNGNSLFETVTDKIRISHCFSDARTTFNPMGSPSQDYHPYLSCSTSKSVYDKIYMKYCWFFFLFHKINLFELLKK